MPTGLPPAGRDLDRTTLLHLLDAAGPAPLPAAQAIPLLQRLHEPDAAVFGALAYRALTGVEPGATPRPAAEIVAGFPPFASEVLQRAVTGAAERPPTPAALLIVLETVPAGSWPALPEAMLTEARVEVDGPQPAPEAEPIPEPEPVVAPRGMHEEFRDLVDAKFDVPRFEPLEGSVPEPTRAGAADVRRARERRRRGGARRGTRSRSRATAYTSKGDRQQTLLVVALLVVLITVGALYAAFHDPGATPSDDPAPQGASRSISHPVEVSR